MRLAQEGQIIESAEDIIKRGVTGTVKELLSIINSIHDAIWIVPFVKDILDLSTPWFWTDGLYGDWCLSPWMDAYLKSKQSMEEVIDFLKRKADI